MKKLICFLVLLSFSCGSKKNATESTTKPFELGLELTARVTKVDSIENYYVINIRDENKLFKLVSKKSSIKPYQGPKIENGNSYFFKIRQLTDRKPNGNENISVPTPMNHLDVKTCLPFENTEICTESGFELATAYNVLGLYLKAQ